MRLAAAGRVAAFAHVSEPASHDRRTGRRSRRWPWILAGGIIAGGAVVVGLLFAPAVQGWALRKAVATQPGWSVEFEEFGLAPSGVEAQGLKFAMPGIVAQVEPLMVKIAPGRLLMKRELQIERVEAAKVRVTLTPAEMAGGDASAPFTGVLSLLQSPLPWLLDEAKLDGEIAVRDGEETVVVGVFKVNGGKLSATTPGEFSYEIEVNSALLPPGPDNKVRSKGTVRLTQTAAHGVARIEIAGDLALPRYGALALPVGKFSFAITTSANGEDYSGRIDFGDAVSGELKAALDAAALTLGGRVDFKLSDGTLASTVAETPLPVTTASGGAEFSLDLGSGEGTVELAGKLDAREFGRLAPELSVLESFTGHFQGQLVKRGAELRVESGGFELRNGDAAAVRLKLSAPVDVLKLPEAPIATLSLEHLPLAWANPWLASSGAELTAAHLGGEWSVAVSADKTIQLEPTKPCETTAFTAKGADLPPIPPVKITFSPKMTVSASRATVEIQRLVVTAETGDKLTMRVAAEHDLETGTTHTTGRARGALPTLLSGADQPLPFSLTARWDMAVTGSQLRVEMLEFMARKREIAEPFFALQMLRPLIVDLGTFKAGGDDEVAGDWVKLKFQELQLGWISRWIPGYTFSGAVNEGESVLRSAEDGRLTFVPVKPWRIGDAALSVGGRSLFRGELRVTPSFEISADTLKAELGDLLAQDRDGSRVSGRIALDASRKDQRGSTEIEVDAELPALPHSADTFGPVRLSLRAKSHNETTTIAAMDEFHLRVRNEQGELLTMEATEPFIFGLANSGMFTAATLAPLRVTTGEIPLAWLRPWSGALETSGVLQPSEFALTAKMTKFLLRPIRPVQVREFAARFGGRELARDTQLTLYPGIDLTLLCMPVPEFTLAYSGTVHLTDAAIDIGGKRAFDLDAAFAFLGDAERVLPRGMELTTRVDFAPFAALPALAGRGLPTRGNFVARINGDMLGKEPLEHWARLEGVPARDGKRILPPLEILAHGEVIPQEGRFVGDVALRLETQPRVTDASFEVTGLLGGERLEIGSTFRSEYFNAADMLELATAFQPTSAPRPEGELPPEASTPAPHGAPVVYEPQGQPFWAGLRGAFDLDMRAVEFAPYRIANLRGRLDVGDREFALTSLNGEMFAGHWRGNVIVDYDGGRKEGDHALAGEFRIEQFDTARVVQTVFPNELALVDARVDVSSTVRSRGNAIFELIDRAEGDFTIEGREGIVRLKVPQQEKAATAAVFGGAILLSPELRALGRLLKKFAEMPVDQIKISGERTAGGDVALNELRIESPQARLVATGRIPAVEGQPLMNRPLELSIDLAAKDEMAVILGGMSLIEKKPREDGYRPLKEKFVIRGKAGEPDTRPLYDLLAKAVVGSKGTWGFLMRKVQNEVNKMKAGEPKKTAMIERPTTMSAHAAGIEGTAE